MIHRASAATSALIAAPTGPLLFAVTANSPARPRNGAMTPNVTASRANTRAADRYGLNRTDMRALDIVGQAGPLAPTALGRLLGFTTGGVTSVLDRLERAGYIRRQPDPSDRRRQ